MSTTATASSVIFDAVEYEREEGNIPDWESVTTTSSMQEAHPRYMAPHKRPIRLEMGDYTQVQVGPKPDEQGVLNRSFQKLMVYIHYALTKVHIESLSKRFPGCFFVSDSHGNHDHPIAHAVTMVGTRFLQRMIRPGSNILDVYGNPNACDAFNHSQRNAKNPKVMYPSVANACPSDFIREVNKWGPSFDTEGQRYIIGSVKRLGNDVLGAFDVFQCIHTLYYLKCQEICQLLHSFVPGEAKRQTRKKLFALIHVHDKAHGFLNDGEQEYWVKNGIVKQRNVKTNTTYLHPDIKPFWFRENKVWYEVGTGVGFTWECHFVCEDTWIIEVVGCLKEEEDQDFVNDWDFLFECGTQAEAALVKNSTSVKPLTVLPTPGGPRGARFVQLNVCSDELFGALRRRALGKARHGKEGRDLVASLYDTARNLVHPNDLFPDRKPIVCPDDAIADHVASAFLTDLQRETDLQEAVKVFAGATYRHHGFVTGKFGRGSVFEQSFGENARGAGRVAVKVAQAARHPDAVGKALNLISDYLED